ncbi:class IV adenylate cyclase [Kitasatospora sp. NPDC097605]|uniref:class IV adenylate cyclase n=1 Tax=Kitasatospora sp. NPDC097605 TaxID=3157226 RepID=UPI0033246CE1
MKYIEVEQKFRLLSPAGELKAQLSALGATPGRPGRQVDTYYNAPHRDFLDNDVVSEWLRVRVEDGAASVNFKRFHPIESPAKTHCDEYESVVGDVEAVRRLLGSLDFAELTVVDKTREEWHADGIAVAFDTVAGLGDFVEFEFKGDADTVDRATTRLEAFIAALDIELGDRIHLGYPHMTLGLEQSTPSDRAG